ncbi:hypothetical protein COCSUDRAFT_49231 [Coccomyxa subellipsoidea C-169]|uniref:Uncharacterized protein n=1 Tax=Coccomyxa subellipsoidea (strain C-169) TaxID=574566 RepID=I0YJD3_COCSC|nr:hypothetical protein COCSUDRAFT_49231 [Coccomyxa subellipsoidea C-169]EIE18502.1 hypothetical protein COCSUDRAFT_49231 [Coccomyxa subellipsoidea C-169]|eukprot:XP_005643046.1 hypothetical protein COCSUDRAFT_49231 [Coccomyxa subellipsoidea C-169]
MVSSTRLAVVLGLAVLSGSLVQARFVIEQGGLKISFPKAAAKAHPKGFDMSLANFGAPKYGGSLMGKLVYVDADHGHPNTCIPSCNYACQPFSQASPPFKLNPSTNPDRPGQRTNYIMLVDRGPLEDDMAPCKFAEKVWNAQEAGAQGVVVVNYEDKHTTMEAPDDQDEISYRYLRNITIPAAFITKSDGQVLKDLFKKTPGNAQPDDVYVVLDWNDVLPRARKVEWEFWTNSNDMCGAVCDVQKEFIKEFVPVARELEGNWTRFTPHYIVWVCPESYRSSDECQSQCIHNGRYCTPDPDGDLLAGYSGKDIVQENLRQLCVFKLANESGVPWKWWEYSTKFGEQCKMVDNQYNEECAERVFNELEGNTWSSLAKLRACIGDVAADADNALLESEMKRQRGNSDTGEVYILPTIRINDGQYRGKLSYTEVLRAICAGFTRNAEPKACMRVAVDDSCRDGSLGHSTCAARKDGKTKCQNTFSGYECVCGPGFILHVGEGGKEKCLNINECVSTEAADLDPKCTCERCACKDTYGGYECIANIRDDCAHDYAGCWRGDFKVNGKSQTFHACKDNIALYKDAAARGKPLEDIPLHSCTCPPCFTEYMNNGKMECVPKCDLATCDAATGICSGGFGGSGGLHSWAVVLIVFACLGVVGGAGFVAYRLRLRSAMHQEIRAIMAQYMPLESQEGVNGELAMPRSPATNGAVPHTDV